LEVIRFEQKKNDHATVVLVLLVIAFIFGYFVFHRIGLDAISEFVSSMGIFAPIAFIILMAIAVIVSPIPSIPLDILGGSLFGGFWGGLYAAIGAVIGAIIAFVIARRFGRSFIARFYPEVLAFCDKCYGKSIVWIIFGTRLLPVFQFDIVSYASGLLNVKLWKFAVATFFGLLPVTFILSYSGKAILFGEMWLSILLTVVLIFSMYFVPKYLIKGFHK